MDDFVICVFLAAIMIILIRIEDAIKSIGNQAELDRLGIVDCKDYLAAVRAIGSGL